MLEFLNNNGFTWINVSSPNRDDMRQLGQRFPFHELNLDDCLSKIQIPKIDRYESHLFLILNFPNIEKETIPKASQLSVFMGPNYLVTVHQGDLKPLTDMFDLCRQNEKQRQELMGRSSGYLFHSIIDSLVDDLLKTIRRVVDNIDDIEDQVFDERISVAKEISHLRRQVTSMRRTMIPMRRTVLEFSAKDIQRFSEEDLTAYFDDVKDHIEKAVETLEESKETIEIFKDTDFMHSSDKSSKILAVLTIIFTLSIPATIIGSFYGMNVHIPGEPESAPWTFLGQYTTFIMVIIVSSAIALIMLGYFHKLKWI